MSINLNNAIYTLLTENASLKLVVGTKIFPLIIPENTILPAVVIERDFLREYNNDSYNDDSNVEITILSTDYNTTINIAILIDNILGNYKGEISNINIYECKLISCDEGFQEDSFIQKLIYNLKNN